MTQQAEPILRCLSQRRADSTSYVEWDCWDSIYHAALANFDACGIPYRGYHYARKRRPGTFTVYWEITHNGAYVSYADTVAEAMALIDRYTRR
jgi:hypothetical protein